MYKKRSKDVVRAHCSAENVRHKYELAWGLAAVPPVNLPKDSQKYDLYLSEEGLCELMFSSQQLLAKAFRKHCCNFMFPHILQQLIDRVIEEKEAALALLTNCNNQIQAIQDENVGLQGEIRAYRAQIQDLTANRYVPGQVRLTQYLLW